MEEQVIKRARLCQKIVEAAASTVGGQAEDFATTAFVDLIAGVGDHFALRTVVLLDSSGNTITSTTGETIIGARDGVSYSLRIILKGRLLCEKFAAMKINAYTDLSCALKLHYHNVIYSTPSDGYSLFTDGRVQSLGHFDAQATSKLIDITFFLKEAYQNYCEGRTVSDIILSLRHSGSLTYLQSAGNVRVVNEYASFYLENSTIVTNRPSLIVTDRSSPLPEESPKEKINVGEIGTSIIHLADQSVSHVLPLGSIRIAKRSVPFSLRFDPRVLAWKTDAYGFGNGWTSNLCQRLVRGELYNPVENGYISYLFDGEGKRHAFIERWYYLNGITKVYLRKEEVYQKAKGQLFYTNAFGTEYEVKIERKGEDGLTLITSRSQNYVSKEDDLVDWSQTKLALDFTNKHFVESISVDGTATFPHFYQVGASGKVFYDLRDVTFNSAGTPVISETPNSPFAILSTTMYQVPYFLTGVTSGKVMTVSKTVDVVDYYREILGDNDYQFTLRLIAKRTSDVDGSHYVSDDLKNVRAKLKNYEEYKDNQVANGAGLRNSLFELSQEIDRMGIYSVAIVSVNANANASASATKIPDYVIANNKAEFTALKRRQSDLEATLGQTNKKIAETLVKIRELKKEEDYLRHHSESEATDFVLDQEGHYWAFDFNGNLLGMGEGDKTLLTITYEEGKILRFTSDEETLVVKRDKNAGTIEFVMPDGKTVKETIRTDSSRFGWTGGNKEEIEADIVFFADGTINTVTEPLLAKLTISKPAAGSMTIVRQLGTEISSTWSQTLTDINEVITLGQPLQEIDNLRGHITRYFLDGQKRLVSRAEAKTASSDTRLNESFYHYSKTWIEDSIYHNDGNSISNPSVTRDSSQTIATATFPLSSINAAFSGRSVPRGQSYCIEILIPKESVVTPTNFSFDVLLKFQNGTSTLETVQRSFAEITGGSIAIPFSLSTNAAQIFAEIILHGTGAVFMGSPALSMKLFFCHSTSQEFDEDGRLISKTDGSCRTSYSQFNGKNPTMSISNYFDYHIERNEYRYDAKNRLVFTEDGQAMCQEKRFDENGRLIEERSYPRLDPSLASINVYSYDSEGNKVKTQGAIRDGEGNLPDEVETYSAQGQLRSLQKLNGSIEAYGYDPYSGDQTSLTEDADGLANTTRYTYRKGFLKKIENHGVQITYTYDGKHRPTKIMIGSVTMGDYSYTDRDGSSTIKADEIHISQGDYNVTTTINDEGLVAKIHDAEGDDSYFYDKEKRLLNKTWPNGHSESFTYEWDGRVLNDTIQGNGLGSHEKVYTYGNTKSITSIAINFGSANWEKTAYTYYANSENHEWVASATLSLSTTALLKKNFVRDALGRATSVTYDVKTSVGALQESFDYLQQGERTLPLVKHHSLSAGNNSVDETDYAFDVMGNIISAEEGDKETRYAYDRLNRLVREDNPHWQKSYRYAYDAGGNLLSRKEYPYSLEEHLGTPTRTVPYVYAKEGWRDRLLSYDGQACVYDTYGRPTTYRGNALVWNAKGTLASFGATSYAYDRDGLRTGKTVAGVTTTYIRHGMQLLKSTKGNEEIHFRYLGDELVGFGLSGKEYLYGKNAQGDIVALIDADTLAILARYVYDAWGNPKVLNPDGTENTSSSFVGHKNPFRYRGYFFDEETGLYYLNARYYDPQVGRFISPDSLSVLDTTRLQVNGLNLYMYCADNPIEKEDPSGRIALIIAAMVAGAVVGAAVGGLFGGLTALANNQNIGIGILTGAIGGAIMGAGAGAGSYLFATAAVMTTVSLQKAVIDVAWGLFAASSSGFVGGFVSDFLTQQMNGRSEIDWGSCCYSGLEYSIINTVGAMLGALTGVPSGTFWSAFIEGVSSGFVFSNVTSAIGFLVDVLRNNAQKQENQSAKRSPAMAI